MLYKVVPLVLLFSVLLLGVSFILVNYLIDKQKEDFKKDNDIDIWGKKAEYISTTKGSKLLAPMPNKTIEVEITDPVFIDPSNERLNA